MNDFETDLKLAMDDIAAQPPRDGFAAELRTRLRPKRPDRRRLLVPALAGMATAAVALLAVQGVTSGSGSPSVAPSDEPRNDGTAGYNGAGVVEPGEKCSGAVEAAPAELALSAQQPIWLPAVTQFQVTDAWACGQGSAPILMFGEVQVSYEEGWSDVNVKQMWADLTAEDGGYVTDVAGISTLVHEATKDAPNNEVMLVKNDTLIRLLSTGNVPIDDLVSLAKSLNLTAPAIAGK